MFSLPMALIGAVLGLFIAGSELSIMSLIGIILLMGLVAKNGILLIDFTKQRRNEGLGVKEALIEAGAVRLRPILMTTNDGALFMGLEIITESWYFQSTQNRRAGLDEEEEGAGRAIFASSGVDFDY